MSRDLTKGSINENLIKLALPIMGTSFLQMAYNLTDIYWVGRLGEDSIAAVGTAGYYLWFSFAFVLLVKVGAEVKVAQSLGARDYKKTNKFSENAMLAAALVSITYMLVILVFKSYLIDFFDIKEVNVGEMAKSYLFIAAFSFPFGFFIQVVSSIYNASGNSKLPFKINGMGLIVNMLLDPLLILYFDMGVRGAAIATVTAQVIVAFIFVWALKTHPPYKAYKFVRSFDGQAISEMIEISYPPALQSGLFTIIAMVVARLVTSFGTEAMAVHRIGSQLEAITFMTAGGFGVALSGMVGQNFGAKNFDRVRHSIRNGFLIMASFGLFTTFLLIVFAKQLFGIFIDTEPVLSMGQTYLHIVGLSQFFMCVEITLGGGFNGLGKSKYPAAVSIIFNALRIPFAYFFVMYTSLGLNGIWWAISGTTMFKGTTLSLLVILVLRRFINQKEREARA